MVTLVIIAALAFAASQFLNGSARETSFNATLTALAVAAAPTATSTPVPATDTPAPTATGAVVAAVLTASETPAPTLMPTDTAAPTLSSSELSATAGLVAGQTTQIGAQQTQTQAVHVTAQALVVMNQTASAQLQETQTALAASPTPSVTPIPTDTPAPTLTPLNTAASTATATSVPTDTPAPTLTPTSMATATTLPTDTPAPTLTPSSIPTSTAAATTLPTDTRTPLETPTQLSTEQAGLQIIVPAGHPVLIGLSAAISGSNAPIGIDIRRALELVLQRRPEVVMYGHTYPITLDVRDDACSINRSREVANEFVSDASVVAVIGPMCSPGCRVAIPIYDAARFTTISPSCTASDLTTNGSTSFNRVVTSDALQGRTAAAYLYNVLHISQIGVVGLNNSYSQGLVDSLTTTYTALGGEIVAYVTIEPGSNTLRQQMQTLANSQPDLIFFAGTGYMLQQLAVSLPANLVRSLSVPFMVMDTLKNAQGATYSSNARLYVVAPMPPGGDAIDLLLSDYAATYGEQPTGPYHAEAFDALHLLIDAIEGTATVDESGNLIIDRAMLADYIRHVRDAYGANGLLTANGSGELSTVPVGVFHTVDGKLEHVGTGTLDPASGKFALEEIAP